jgi:hypothetical protein
MKFEYEIEGSFDDVMANFCSERDPKAGERIRIELSPTGSISILGNKDGWLYLAKICVEMAYSYEADPHYHHHRKVNLAVAMRDGEEKVDFLPIEDD